MLQANVLRIALSRRYGIYNAQYEIWFFIERPDNVFVYTLIESCEGTKKSQIEMTNRLH